VNGNAQKNAGGQFGDRAFKWLTLVMALTIFALVRAHRLRTVPRLAPRAAKIRLAFSRHQRLGSGQRRLWRAAVHLRHARVGGHRTRHRRAHQHRHRRLSHRTRAAPTAPAAYHVHRTARRRAKCHSRPVGNFCDGSFLRDHFFRCCKNISASCRFLRGRSTASA